MMQELAWKMVNTVGAVRGYCSGCGVAWRMLLLLDGGSSFRWSVSRRPAQRVAARARGQTAATTRGSGLPEMAEAKQTGPDGSGRWSATCGDGEWRGGSETKEGKGLRVERREAGMTTKLWRGPQNQRRRCFGGGRVLGYSTQ